MAKEYAAGFYASKQWHKCRESYIKHRQSVDGGMCERCRERLGYIVHHKRGINRQNIGDSEVTFNWGNLEYVCKDCHEIIHHYCNRENFERRRVKFDSLGNPTPDTPTIHTRIL